MGIETNSPSVQPMPAAPPPAGPQQHKDAGKGLAITALVIAIVSLLLCWIPIVNNMVFFLGIIALGFAIPAAIISFKRRSKAKGMSIAALIIAVLSLVGVIATQAFYVSMIDSVAEAVEEGADGVVPVTEAEQEAAAEVPALALGTSSPVGNEYNVTINSVNLDAAADILAMNEFNEDASGQYVLVDVTAEYTGSEEGDPWIDLSVNFVGSDARQYDSSTCMASLETGAFDVPTLENGGMADYQLCMDVPADAVDGGKLFVEPTISFDNESRIYWAVQ